MMRQSEIFQRVDNILGETETEKYSPLKDALRRVFEDMRVFMEYQLDTHSRVDGLKRDATTSIHTILRLYGISSSVNDELLCLLNEMANEATQEAPEAKRFFDSLPVGAYRTDPDGNIIEMNHALLDMLGYSSLEEMQRVKAEDIYADPAKRDAITRKLLAKGTVNNARWTAKHKDGHEVTVREDAFVVKDEDGNPMFYEGTLMDVSWQINLDNAVAGYVATVNHENERLVQENVDLREEIERLKSTAPHSFPAEV